MVLLVLLGWSIRRHYDSVHHALFLYRLIPPRRPIRTCSRLAAPTPATARTRCGEPSRTRARSARHLTVVPIVRLDLCGLRALAYAASLGQPVLAVHISPGDDEAARFKHYWVSGAITCRSDRRLALPGALAPLAC